MRVSTICASFILNKFRTKRNGDKFIFVSGKIINIIERKEYSKEIYG
jgi:hypothetical protein